MNLPKPLLLAVLFSLFFCSARAQIDSLKSVLKTAEGVPRVQLLNKISFTYGYSNFDSARYYGELALASAQTLGYIKEELEAMINVSYSYFDEGRTDTAIYITKICLVNAHDQGQFLPEMDAYLALGNFYDDKNKLDSAAWAYSQNISIGKENDRVQKTTAAVGNLGNLYKQQGLYDLAIGQYVAAAELNLSMGNVNKQANYLANIGFIYLETDAYEQALTYFTEAYDLVKDSDYNRNKWHALTGKSLVHVNLKQYEQAMEGFEMILKEAKESGDPYQVPSTLHNLADLSNEQGEHKKALVYCLEALERFEALQSQVAITQTHSLLCSIYGELGQTNQALLHCDTAWALAKAHELSATFQDIYEIKSNVLSGALRYEEAYATRLQYEKTKDERQSAARARNIEALNTQFKTKEKELQIKVQEEQLAGQETFIKQQRAIQLLILVVLLFVVGLAMVIWKNNKKQRTVNAQLSEQKEIIERTSKERETLLKEIHHRVKNNLQVISSLLSMQSRQMEDGEAKIAVREGQSRIKSMSLIHQKLYSQDELSRINMSEYIDELSHFLFKSYKANNHIEAVINTQRCLLDVDTAVPLGLIINELIANALKYAFDGDQMGVVQVNLESNGEEYKLRISDNGKGLPEGWNTGKSMGMRLVHILVDQIDGTLHIDGDSGTSFTITFRDTQAA
ncbi:tetratricopeptide repeat protein [Reichenbachiella carrageenanivorans]|uniref:Tetratricopeptide repeat protein n=1 Tax=Reichenbachiella carrageenanivorans TaxID=2979869 RepID=A0ABY6CVQ5_9BACT|nr:histidine kinase dimerization/phosphoacceptor domain -containing protein [Reichenbachiella carrageenanivorans]UXX77948.1 tetratricopeptide repeat protein [Reichenbachiella carrageenanivorans]